LTVEAVRAFSAFQNIVNIKKMSKGDLEVYNFKKKLMNYLKSTYFGGDFNLDNVIKSFKDTINTKKLFCLKNFIFI